MNYVPPNLKNELCICKSAGPPKTHEKQQNLKKAMPKLKKFKHLNLKNSASQARWPKTTTCRHVKRQKVAQIKARH